MSVATRIAVATPLDLRRWPRFSPPDGITVRIATQAVALDLRDLSVGGFAVTAARAFAPGLTHKFVFRAPSGIEVTLVAKAVHSTPRSENGLAMFVTGWEFMAGSMDATEAAIARLVGTPAGTSA